MRNGCCRFIVQLVLLNYILGLVLSMPAEAEDWPPAKLDTCLPKYGIMDIKGKVIVPDRFFLVDNYGKDQFILGTFDHQNPKQSPESVYLVDGLGTHKKIELPPNVQYVTNYRSLLVVVDKKEKVPFPKVGLYTIDGEKVLDINYANILHVSHSVIVACTKSGEVRFFDGIGKPTFHLPSDYISNEKYSLVWSREKLRDHFQEGLLSLCDRRTNRSQFAYCDIKGNLVKSGFLRSGSFSEGLAWAEQNENEREKICIDREFKARFKLPINFARNFENGFAVFSKDLKYGIVSRDGNVLVEPIYPSIGRLGGSTFSLIAGSSERPSEIVVVDLSTGLKFRPPPGTVAVSPSGDDLLLYRTEKAGADSLSLERWGYLSRIDGSISLSPRFVYAGAFKYGMAPVARADRQGWPAWGLIDKQGKYLIAPQFEEVEVVAPDRIKFARKSVRQFSYLDWSSKPAYLPISRIDEIRGFFHDYDVIGMTKERLFKVLGTPFNRPPSEFESVNEVYYDLVRTGCPNAYSGIYFRISGNKVNGWCVYHPSFTTRSIVWVTKNGLRKEDIDKVFEPLINPPSF